MIYRGSMPAPFPLLSASWLSFSVFLCVAGSAYWRERGELGGRGTESYDRKKAWPSINRSILYELKSLCHEMNNIFEGLKN
jgi:hypothetical protein